MSVRSGRSGNKQPQDREAQKPKQKSFQDECKERLGSMHEAKREQASAAKRAEIQAQEEETMRMTYGPNWRTRELPHDPRPVAVAPLPAVRPSGVMLVHDDDEPSLKAG